MTESDTRLHVLGVILPTKEEITNYFIRRESPGFVEGFNNRLKVLKRRCYGLFNLHHLFQRIYLDLEGFACSLADHQMWPNHDNSQRA